MPISRAEAGFTYLAVLLAVAFLGLGLGGATVVWGARADRERLARMDAIGAEYVAAIAAYRNGTPGIVVGGFPPDFAALVRDPRLLAVRRTLRREYPNPFTGAIDWEIVAAPGGGILGIRGRGVVDGRPVVREYVYRAPPPVKPR